jgi:hypothetical protein
MHSVGTADKRHFIWKRLRRTIADCYPNTGRRDVVIILLVKK